MEGSTAPASNKSHSKPENQMIALPKQLEDIPVASEFPSLRHRWNTNEEIASILIAFDKHKEWQLRELRVRPPSGSMLLYSRNKVRYRKDGYCWKKRKDGKTIREDHMKLKVRGLECIYGSYVHSAILPTFHRRCYWLLQNPDIVLVHYLNVPYPDNAKLSIPVVSYGLEKKEWTKDELADQLRPMFSTGRPGEGVHDSEQVIEETVEAIVHHLIEYQEKRIKTRNHKCDVSCDKNCLHSKCCKISPKGELTTGSGSSSTVHSRLVSLLQRNKANQTTAQGTEGSMIIASTTTQSATNNLDIASTNTPVIFNVANLQGSNSLLIVSGQTTSAPLSIISNSMTSQTVTVGSQLGQSIQAVPQLAAAVKAEPQDSSSTGNCRLPQTSASDTVIPVPMATDISETGDSLKDVPKEITIKTEPLGIFTPGFQLSHDDVQKTLQATVSSSSDFGHSSSKDGSSGLDNCDNLQLSTASLQNSDLSLDSLDILDLPDLDKLCSDISPSSSDQHGYDSLNGDFSGTIPLINCASCLSNQRAHQQQQEPPQQSSLSVLAEHQQPVPSQEAALVQQPDSRNSRTQETSQGPITDFCPEWSYAEGGTKVLVTGPWYSSSCSYTCSFDGNNVAAILVQPGVLRCFAPAHEPGLVTLHVESENFVISNSVVFEYRNREKHQSSLGQQDWFTVDEDQLRLMVLERLEQLEKRLSIGTQDKDSESHQTQGSQQTHDFERHLVQHITQLAARPWSNSDAFPKAGPGGMNLLHLAGALGYADVIQTLIRWRSDNPSLVLEYEVDAHNVDDFSCTPLMWACAKGYLEAALTLYHWNRGPLKVCNKDGLLPLAAARQKGHHNLANSIDQLEQAHNSVSQLTPGPGSVDGNMSDPFLTSSKMAVTSPQSIISCDQSPSFSLGTSPPSSTQTHAALFTEVPPPPPYPGDSKLVRRMSEECLGNVSRQQRLSKRFSVDLISLKSDSADRYSSQEVLSKPVRESNSEPYLSSFSSAKSLQLLQATDGSTGLGSPDMLMQTDSSIGTDHLDQPSRHATRRYSSDNHLIFRMDTDELSSVRSDSPFIDVERISSDDETNKTCSSSSDKQNAGDDGSEEEAKNQMVTLAKQIIAAMPERIKSSPSHTEETTAEVVETRERSGSHSSFTSQNSPHTSSYGEDSGISTPLGEGLAFEDYRYTDLGTPASSLSPDSTCLASPYSPYFQIDSPPPTTADFTEYFNAPATFMEKDFSQLTLSDQEQRKLYEAAKVIQNAYRQYRDKQQLQQQRQKEIEAAILIQSYYRRYKQYAYFKKMTQAAVLIQSQFRSYYAQKRYKKSREALQNQYRNYKEPERLKKSRNTSVIIQQRFRSHYQRRQPDDQDGSQLNQYMTETGDSSPPDQSTMPSDEAPAAAANAEWESTAPPPPDQRQDVLKSTCPITP